MLAKIFAMAIVILAILGPGFFLWQFARTRGGAARKLAWVILMAAGFLIAWLLFAPGAGSTPEERTSQFIGAWAILFMAAGFVVIGAEVFKMINGRKRP
jgi:hypothetical protein